MLSKFQNLSTSESDSPTSALKVHFKHEKIEAEFYHRKIHEKIIMDSNEEFWTLLEEFLRIQKNQLNFLKVQFDERGSEDVNDVLENLGKSLTPSPIKIKRLFLEVNEVNQAIAILKHLDPEFLKKIEMRIMNLDRKIDIDNVKFLVDWNKGKPLKFVLNMDKIFDENLEIINKLFFNWSTFTEVDLIYKSFESLDPCEFFDVPFDFQKSENRLRFRLHSGFRLAPSLVKLTLSNEKSSQVLENPLIMERVVQYFKLFDIQRLRKTSRGIRTCVDHLKPDPKIKEYLMLMRTDKCISSTVTLGYRNAKNLVYRDDILPQISAFCEANFKNQKTCMEELKLIFSYCDKTEIFRKSEDSESLKTLILETLNPITSEFLAQFQKILEARSEPLKVQKLDLMSVSPSEVMQILPYLDVGTLKILKIRDPYLEYCRLFNRRNYPESLKIPYDIEEIAKTEQWKNAKELEIHSVPISTPIQKMNLIEFSKMYISDVQRVTSEDVAYLKENLLTTSSTLDRFIISFTEFADREHLYDHIGHPSRIYTEDRKLWYSQFPNSKYYLEIDLGRSVIYFERVYGMRYIN